MQEDKKIEDYILLADSAVEPSSGLAAKISLFLESRYFLATIVILVAVVSFLIGRLVGLETKREPVRVWDSRSQSSGEVKGLSVSREESVNVDNKSAQSKEGVKNSNSTNNAGGDIAPNEIVVASKNGTKYHYPWCAGAKQISEKNKITFASIGAARAAGYSPATNCKGLK